MDLPTLFYLARSSHGHLHSQQLLLYCAGFAFQIVPVPLVRFSLFWRQLTADSPSLTLFRAVLSYIDVVNLLALGISPPTSTLHLGCALKDELRAVAQQRYYYKKVKKSKIFLQERRLCCFVGNHDIVFWFEFYCFTLINYVVCVLKAYVLFFINLN